MQTLKVMILFLMTSCSGLAPVSKPSIQEAFSKGEIILSTQLLNKIFDEEMAPLACVPDTDEAALLLRTINPRMEAVQDDYEADLDDQKAVSNMVQNCDQDCTCQFVDDLVKEHMVSLDKDLKNTLLKKIKQKGLNSCLNFARETFCDSEVFKALSKEKADFSYEEDDS
jgi:hypothetical protein